MRYLKAVVVGSVAVAVLAGAAVAVVSAVASSGALGNVHVDLAGIVLVDVRRIAGATQTTIGPALPLLALVGGTLNAAALAALLRRRRDEQPIP